MAKTTHDEDDRILNTVSESSDPSSIFLNETVEKYNAPDSINNVIRETEKENVFIAEQVYLLNEDEKDFIENSGIWSGELPKSSDVISTGAPNPSLENILNTNNLKMKFDSLKVDDEPNFEAVEKELSGKNKKLGWLIGIVAVLIGTIILAGKKKGK